MEVCYHWLVIDVIISTDKVVMLMLSITTSLLSLLLINPIRVINLPTFSSVYGHQATSLVYDILWFSIATLFDSSMALLLT